MNFQLNNCQNLEAIIKKSLPKKKYIPYKNTIEMNWLSTHKNIYEAISYK